MSITVSVMTGGSNSHPTTSEEANGQYTDFVTPGIVGTLANTGGIAPATGGFAANAQGTPDATVAVSAGVAYVRAQPASQNSQIFRVVNSASSNVTISANASGSTKYDWLYIKLDATLLNTPTLAGTTTGTLVTSRSSSPTSDDGTPPTYGIAIAVITVANGFSTLANSVIRDVRTQAAIGVTANSNADWKTGIMPVPNTIVYNGNRNCTLTFNTVDLTGYTSIGMRLRSTRAVPAPTQCTLLNGTTQYFSKTSPAGMTYTDDFVVSAHVKLTAYGGTQNIASRYNGTSGWQLILNASGQVALVGYNAAAANFSEVLSYQSIPFNKWVHITAQLDMSTFTATTTTSYIMIDGVDVPASVVRAGTSPTSLIQAGNLVIGAENAGTNFFNGKIAQVAIFNAKVTQATIRGYIPQSLLGTETSLISAYSFNNTINDLNVSNANNLTANGAAAATNSDGPFGAQASGAPSTTLDYGIVVSSAFSTNTTLVVQVPEGCTIPTTGGLSAVAYSGVKAPYGMPISKGKWRVAAYQYADTGAVAITISTVTNSNIKLNVPIGDWILGARTTVGYNASVGVAVGRTFIGTAASLNSAVPGLYSRISDTAAAVSTNDTYLSGEANDGLSLAAAADYTLYLYLESGTGTVTSRIYNGSLGNSVTQISADLATL